jgi:hypothetical protein
MELECGNGVLTPFIRPMIRAITMIMMMDGNEERWPDIQRLPDWCAEVAENY